jgi:hypothetical protein
MFREQTEEQLAHTQLQKSESDKAKDAKELAQTLKMEIPVLSFLFECRSFGGGGAFVVRGLQDPNGNNILCHKPAQSYSDLSLDKAKVGIFLREKRK